MSHLPNFIYQEIKPERIDELGPLWEKLRLYHAALLWIFSDHLQRATFEARKREFLSKLNGGKLRIEVVKEHVDAPPIAYCVSSVSSEKRGEIDSIFVEEAFRRAGIGSELIQRALRWMDNAGAISKTVVVADENEKALALYARFGFRRRTVTLEQLEEGTPKANG